MSASIRPGPRDAKKLLTQPGVNVQFSIITADEGGVIVENNEETSKADDSNNGLRFRQSKGGEVNKPWANGEMNGSGSKGRGFGDLIGEEVSNPVVQNVMDGDRPSSNRHSSSGGYGMSGTHMSTPAAPGLIDDDDDMYNMMNDSFAR
jgi:hypothetical protein